MRANALLWCADCSMVAAVHFVIEQPDGTRALLPAWMTEPWAAQLAIVEMPRLTLEALFTLRSTIDGALLSLSSSSIDEGGVR